MAYSESRPLAVVTGASSGIGYELADLFAETAKAKIHAQISEPGSAS